MSRDNFMVKAIIKSIIVTDDENDDINIGLDLSDESLISNLCSPDEKIPVGITINKFKSSEALETPGTTESSEVHKVKALKDVKLEKVEVPRSLRKAASELFATRQIAIITLSEQNDAYKLVKVEIKK